MADKDQRTLYCGNLSEKVTEDILYELFLQAGPLENVTMPKDKDGKPRRFAFITFKHAVSVPYTLALMNGISLYGKNLNLDARGGAQSERNPFLEKLMQYRNPALHPSANMNFGSNQREPYEDIPQRYDSRRYESRLETPRADYNSWNAYPPPSVAVPYNNFPLQQPVYSPHAQNQPRFQNSMHQPPASSYTPPSYRMPWSRNRR